MSIEPGMGTHERDIESQVRAAYPALVRGASVLCWSSVDVEDVVQETVLRAFESYNSFRGGSSFLTWAYVILTRVAAAANAKRRRIVPGEYPLDQPAQLPPVDSGLIQDEEARALIDAVRSLPQRQREMLTLHFLQELSYAEIAEALGVAVGTVKATLFAAKASLRSTLTNHNSRPR